jgi:hypothetical protein
MHTQHEHVKVLPGGYYTTRVVGFDQLRIIGITFGGIGIEYNAAYIYHFEGMVRAWLVKLGCG